MCARRAFSLYIYTFAASLWENIVQFPTVKTFVSHLLVSLCLFVAFKERGELNKETMPHRVIFVYSCIQELFYTILLKIYFIYILLQLRFSSASLMLTTKGNPRSPDTRITLKQRKLFLNIAKAICLRVKNPAFICPDTIFPRAWRSGGGALILWLNYNAPLFFSGHHRLNSSSVRVFYTSSRVWKGKTHEFFNVKCTVVFVEVYAFFFINFF